MKRIILLELCLLFLATTFQGDNPPTGWYIQTIPVNKNVVDIHFTDTIHGWAVTGNSGAQDSGYILKTTNGGTNWLLNYASNRNFFAIQFLDTNIGYACGGWGIGKLYKTTNSGNNWNQVLSSGLVFSDLHFLNKDTGWICDYQLTFGIGLLKTTNGGINWVQQLNNSYQPQKMFFLNKDTGWVIGANNGKIYRTNNSGNNWFLTYNFGTTTFYSIFFTSSDTGWVTQDENFYPGLMKTTNGGYNWQAQSLPQYSSPFKLFMINSEYGYLSTTGQRKIMKTTDGINWGTQQGAPSGAYGYMFFLDSLRGWAVHYNNGSIDIAATIDGGGPVVSVNNEETKIPKEFKLEQNYPNPFNQSTIINYELSIMSDVKIKIYDINGKEITTLVNNRLNAGKYEVRFDGKDLSSGVYFYQLIVDNIHSSIKKMVMTK